MQINLDQPITQLNGEAFTVPGPDAKPMSLAWVCVEALLWFDPNRPTESGEEKARCAMLATRLYQGGKQDVSIEDLALIKAKIGANIAAPLVVGRAFQALEQRPTAVEAA